MIRSYKSQNQSLKNTKGPGMERRWKEFIQAMIWQRSVNKIFNRESVDWHFFPMVVY